MMKELFSLPSICKESGNNSVDQFYLFDIVAHSGQKHSSRHVTAINAAKESVLVHLQGVWQILVNILETISSNLVIANDTEPVYK